MGHVFQVRVKMHPHVALCSMNKLLSLIMYTFNLEIKFSLLVHWYLQKYNYALCTSICYAEVKAPICNCN